MVYSRKYYQDWMQGRLEIVKNFNRLTCGVCKVEKGIEEFNKSALNKSVNPQCKECSRSTAKKLYRKHILTNLLRLARNRAKRKNIEFSISKDDIAMPEICPLLGIPIVIGRKGRAQSENSPNIDRIDPSKGYIKGNVWIISSRANRIKYNSTIEELELITTKLKEKLLQIL